MYLFDGGFIRVKASDNVQVTKVLVTILDEEGKTLEQGEATSTEGNVIVEAFDLAGNCTKQEA